MKAPAVIRSEWLAPCGINCLLCYRHLGKKPCPGCRLAGAVKPEHCQRCKIRACAEASGVTACFQCVAFPCRLLKALDRSYRTRYGLSLAACGRRALEQGVDAFLLEQVAHYTCPDCGGLISLHDGACSECGKLHPPGLKGRERITGRPGGSHASPYGTSHAWNAYR